MWRLCQIKIQMYQQIYASLRAAEPKLSSSELKALHNRLANPSPLEMHLLRDAIAREQAAIQSHFCLHNAGIFSPIPSEMMEFEEKSPLIANQRISASASSSPVSSKGFRDEANCSSASAQKLFQPRKPEEARKALLDWKRKKTRFLAIMAQLQENSERVRQLLSRERYAEFVARLRLMRQQQAGQRMSYRDSRIWARFRLDLDERTLLDRKSGKPYLCSEDMFDFIHRVYRKPRYGGLRAVYAELKEHYANITLQCVTIYLEACGNQMQLGRGTRISADEEEMNKLSLC